MTTPDISTPKAPDLKSSIQAMRRAAELARNTAIQTGTHPVVVRDGKVQRISADELIAPASLVQLRAADR